MKRREFITLIGGAVATLPFAARGQRAIKLLAYFAPARTQHLVDSFKKGLRDLSYVDGNNIMIQYHFADEQGQAVVVAMDRERALAKQQRLLEVATAGGSNRDLGKLGDIAHRAAIGAPGP